MAKDPTLKKQKKRSHRAQFPTPGFYLFAFLLNLVTIPLALISLWGHTTELSLWLFTVLSVLGLGIAVYSATLQPKESNKKTRKILVASTASYGFILLAVQGVSFLLDPGIILS